MNRKMRRAMKHGGGRPAVATVTRKSSLPLEASTGQAHPDLVRAAQLRTSDPAAAASLALAVAAADPDCLDAWLLAGLCSRMAGLVEQALGALGEAIQRAPDNLMAVRLFAEILAEAGAMDAAADAYVAAMRLAPQDPVLLTNAGDVLRRVQRYDEAIDAYRQALSVLGDNLAVLNNLGLAFHEADRSAEALDCFVKALRIKPEEPDVLFNIGNVYRVLGRHVDAVRIYERCLSLRPDHVNAYTNAGLALKSLNRLEEARTAFQAALDINPEHQSAKNNLAAIMVHSENYDDAVPALLAMVQEQPDNAHALSNLGKAYTKSNRLGDAVDVLLQAIAVMGGVPETGAGLRDMVRPDGTLDPALLDVIRGLEFNDTMATTVSAFAGVFASCGQFEDAFEIVRIATEKTGKDTPVFSDFLMFYSNYHPSMTSEEIYQVYLASADRTAALVDTGTPPVPATVTPGDDPERRLRIGFVSPDFRNHSVANFVEGVLMALDRDAFEPVAFAELRKPDHITERLRVAFSEWHHTERLSDLEMADLIRERRIDILVDVAGHTGGNRLRALYHRPAPVQASWLGYGYTTGLPWIDYFITDSFSAGPDARHVIRESVAALPPFAASFTLKAKTPPEVEPLPALKNGHITFGSLTRAVRVNNRVIEAWARILQAVPGSVLRLDARNYGEAFVRDMYLARFAAYGIESDRLRIGFTPGGAMPIYNDIDIGLDCFPHNSGTTLFESLYMGVPYISLADRPTVGRLGGAILMGLGRPEWVAWNEDEYIRKTVDLAADIPRLAATRAALRGEMQASRLMDGAALGHDMGRALRTMWRRACAGKPPASFTLD